MSKKAMDLTKKRNEKDIEQENLKLKEEIEGLKKAMESLMSTVKSSSYDVKSDDGENAVDIPPTKMIKVTSLFAGGMTLRGAKNQTIRFDRFGVQRPISYEDLIHICNEHRNLAEEGYFFIHNKDVIKSLYLEEYYERSIVDRDTIKNLINLDGKRIKEIYNDLSKNLKETFVDIVIEGMEQGKPEFNDRNKIELINQLCGKNLYEIVERRR